MTEIKRYKEEGVGRSNMEECSLGVWVDYEDHVAIVTALQEQVRTLIADAAIMQAAIDQTIGWQQSVDTENTESVRCLTAIQGKTPKIDAVFREIQAQAVDAAAMSFHEKAFVAFEGSNEAGLYIRADLQQLAARIRAREVQS